MGHSAPGHVRCEMRFVLLLRSDCEVRHGGFLEPLLDAPHHDPVLCAIGKRGWPPLREWPVEDEVHHHGKLAASTHGYGPQSSGYQASKRLVHEEPVKQAGGKPVTWKSTSDEIARGWLAQVDLSTKWIALTKRRPT